MKLARMSHCTTVMSTIIFNLPCVLALTRVVEDRMDKEVSIAFY
jgi:hypothetical protein